MIRSRSLRRGFGRRQISCKACCVGCLESGKSVVIVDQIPGEGKEAKEETRGPRAADDGVGPRILL